MSGRSLAIVTAPTARAFSHAANVDPRERTQDQQNHDEMSDVGGKYRRGRTDCRGKYADDTGDTENRGKKKKNSREESDITAERDLDVGIKTAGQ